MIELDRSRFDKTVEITCLKVDCKKLKSVLKFVKPFTFKKPNLLPVIKLDDKQSLIRLNPDKTDQLLNDEQFIRLVDEYEIELKANQELKLSYDNFDSNEVLSTVLNENNLTNITSFSVIGHIIHLNLKDEHEPVKKLIGQVLLDKNPSQSLVLCKTDKIDTQFRYFNFDVLAKRNESISTIVQVNENGFKFKMDFAKVYWNPRLSTEHNRIIELLNNGDIVYDVFAGIGPFAIPAAKRRKCIVYANDLNPESYKYLNENMKLNKIDNMRTFNLDGRDFIVEVIKENLIENWIKLSTAETTSKQQSFHVIMNLPSIAVEFLDTFIGLIVDKLDDPIINQLYQNDQLIMPIIHCYSFHQTNVGLEKSELIENVKNRLNQNVIHNLDLVYVRKVAPNKDMYRITFKLPKDVLFTDKSVKRQKTI